VLKQERLGYVAASPALNQSMLGHDGKYVHAASLPAHLLLHQLLWLLKGLLKLA
jgi:hypothetical protein